MKSPLSYTLILWSHLLCVTGYASESPSRQEQEEVTQRLKSFYEWPPKADALNVAIPKYDGVSGEVTFPNERLRLKGPQPQDVLLRQAQAKAQTQYQKERCEKLLGKNFPSLKCTQRRESIKANDQVKDLVDTWIPEGEILYSLDRLPIHGEIRSPYWSSDYWNMRSGLTSYRYSAGISYSDYTTAVTAYRQPEEWKSFLVPPINLEALADIVSRWSPAEKYDLISGDESFTLTQEQKREGSHYLGEDGNVEGWFGICHGWAPASVFTPPPVRPVKAMSAQGVPVKWYPDDIRAMVTLAWANGRFQTNFVGGRCDAKKIDRLQNGRVSQPECFDNNPATFHLALGNLIGVQEVPFIMDASYDYSVWNQPVVKYSMEYFNPLNPDQRNSRWDKVAVPYDETFKAQDRFQQPKTRGRSVGVGHYDDSAIQQIVGVIATVSYLGETEARHSETPRDNRLIRVSYTYDLELSQKNGEWIAQGGEWHENTHPDFLWMPQKGAFPEATYDLNVPSINLESIPTMALTQKARPASSQGYPLCKTVSSLVRGSSESGSYPCSQ